MDNIQNSEAFAQKKHLAGVTKGLYKLIRKYGVTPFDGFVTTNITINSSDTAAIDTEGLYTDKIVWKDSQFLLRRDDKNTLSRTYYTNWYESSRKHYYNTEGILNDRFFASKDGYIICGQVYTNPNEADIRQSIKDVSDALNTFKDTTAPATYATKTTVNELENRIEDLEGLDILEQAHYFDGVVKDEITLEQEGTTETHSAPNQILYSTVYERFILKVPGTGDLGTQGSGNATKYYAFWDGSNAYTQIDLGVYISPSAMLVDGNLIEIDLDGLNSRMSDAETQLSHKVEKSEFDTFKTATQTAINSKVNTTVFNAAKEDLEKKISTLQSTTLVREKVESLPTTDIKNNVVYMVPVVNPNTNKTDYCNEYFYDADKNRYELIGSSRPTFDDYTTSAETNRYLAGLGGLYITVDTLKQMSLDGGTPAQTTKIYPMTVKLGDKLKFIYMSGDATDNTQIAFRTSSGDSSFVDMPFGSEVSYTDANAATHIIVRSKVDGMGNRYGRLFLSNATDTARLMTEADVEEIINNLD